MFSFLTLIVALLMLYELKHFIEEFRLFNRHYYRVHKTDLDPLPLVGEAEGLAEDVQH